MQKKLINLLKQNARLSNEELAAALGVSAKEVTAQIQQLEKTGIICRYTAVINEDKLDDNTVTAIMEIKATPKAGCGYSGIAKAIAQLDEVESVRLMSGVYDLLVIVKCADIKQIGQFVSERLSLLDGVTNISTHFVIGRYKEAGKIFDTETDERGLVSP